MQEHGKRFILGAKRGDRAALLEDLESSLRARNVGVKNRDGVRHESRYRNGVAQNMSHPDLKINVLNYRETGPKGRR